MITGQEIFNIVDLFTSQSTINFYDVNDNITMNRKWKIKMYKNDH